MHMYIGERSERNARAKGKQGEQVVPKRIGPKLASDHAAAQRVVSAIEAGKYEGNRVGEEMWVSYMKRQDILMVAQTAFDESDGQTRSLVQRFIGFVLRLEKEKTYPLVVQTEA